MHSYKHDAEGKGACAARQRAAQAFFGGDENLCAELLAGLTGNKIFR